MFRTLLALALTLAALPAAAQTYGPARRPTRYLYVEPAPPPVVVVQPAPLPPPPPRQIVVVQHHTVHQPEPLPTPRARLDTRWFVGAGFGGLALLDGDRSAVPAYALELGLAVEEVELAFHADLAPAFTDNDALYTLGAAFRYRFLPDARLHPRLGFGLESLFRNPEGAETARAFAATGELGLDLDVPTSFGALAVGLDMRAHRGLAGDESARVTVLGFGIHAALRFE
ncbi:MAG: hypothetical protein H6720_25140 [Sandaracinus sp.]|nr:hypothetical protein [Sandaracinus sp.]